MPTLSSIAVHPIKALDPVFPGRISISDIGGLAGDRMYAIIDEHGDYVNGKRTAAVHRLRADVDLETGHVRFRVRGEDSEGEFHLERDRDALEAWLSAYFGLDVALEAGPGGSQTDSAVYGDGSRTGPTLIAAETLREVASWYDGIDAEEMRLRLRPNLVVEDVPAFWADGLVADGGRRFRIGDVTLKGVEPIPRCVVPTQDPHTGAVHEEFRETFLARRGETLPAWADREAFADSLYKVMVVARIPREERDGELAVGDTVDVADTPVVER